MSSINLFWPVFIIIACVLAYTGKVSWWVVLLIVLSQIEIWLRIGEKTK